jgi:hypothetical protein
VAVIAGGAGVLFGLALVLLTAFFVTKVETFDRIAEWAFVAFGLLAVPTILATAGRFSGNDALVTALTAVGVAGAAVVGLGELVITLHLIDFRRVAALITVGFLAFLAWIGAVSVLVIAGGGLPVELGWVGVLVIVTGVAIVLAMARQPGMITGEREPPTSALVAFVVPMIGVVVWMIWLGFSL